MKRYLITYKQKFCGEILVDSYVRTVSSYKELFEIEQRLYSDPHVFSVEWEEVTE
jgi:hypothetical protein